MNRTSLKEKKSLDQGAGCTGFATDVLPPDKADRGLESLVNHQQARQCRISAKAAMSRRRECVDSGVLSTDETRRRLLRFNYLC
jgi:hypothetical protein